MKLPKEYYAFSLYKHPFDNTINLVIQESADVFYNINSYEQGFIIHPFIETKSSPIILIKPDNIFRFHKRQFKETKSFFQNISFPEKEINLHTTTKQEYCDNVNNAKKAIQEELFKKVVLSRVILKPQENKTELFIIVENLLEKYPNAFICLSYHPLVGLWLCVTPELLLNKRNNLFSTYSLAGTQKYNNEEIRTIIWQKKEIEEQAYVTDYILEKINEIGGNQVKKSGPNNTLAGNVVHLKTEIEFELEAKTEEVLKQFHPTPAVCGMPKAEALEFINIHESHNREYYTGYLGEINKEGNAILYVNLRCMQITNKQNIFYAGAGITIDSDDDKEWEETRRKAELLINMFE